MAVPLSRWADFDKARAQHLTSAVRAVADGLVLPLLECCATKAFFNLKLDFLRKVCGHLGVVAEATATVFEVVMTLEKRIFDSKGEEELLASVGQRVQFMRPEHTSMGQVLQELDEGIGIFEPHCACEMKTERKRHDACRVAADVFVQRLSRHKQVPREATGKKSAQTGKRAKQVKRAASASSAP